MFVKRPHVFKSIKRYFWFLYYIPLFIWECIKANIDVAYRVAHPDLPINPGIVKVKTTLKSDTGLTFLANSITLTPGTMSVDIDPEFGFLYIHWINVKDKDIQKATEIIVKPFEDVLRRIFE
jgi:multicomponent Na+:H+ antiporter subunit E